MRKISLLILVMLLSMMASAQVVKIDGINYSLNLTEQVAEVTEQHYRLGEINWSGDYRFASERNSTGDEFYIVPIGLWERMKKETFYVTVKGADPYIRVMDGWWTNIWTDNAISPGNEQLTDNGDGTWTLAVNFAEDPILSVLDERHLLFTGSGYSVEEIYLLDTNADGDSEKVIVWKNEGDIIDIVDIPEKFYYNGVEYTVTGISSNAFYKCSSLTSVSIPNSVTRIESYAFSGCNGLTSVTIPNSVTSIESYVFSGCFGLTSVTIPNSVTNIESFAFKGCSNLTSVTIPNSVTSIGNYAFEYCINLTNVTINSNAIVSETRNPYYPILIIFGNQVKNYIIGEDVTSIGSCAFYNCKDMTSVTIPSSVTAIRDNAFSGCINLTSVNITDLDAWYKISFGNVSSNPLSCARKLFLNGEEVKDLVIPNSVTTINDFVFVGFSGMASVTIPNSVTSIGDGSFWGCTGLSSVKIPNSVTTIGREAFRECNRLTSVTIPNSVATIGYFAFGNCSGLTSITVESGNTKYDSRDDCNAIIETETNTLITGCMNTVVPESVTSIGEVAFANCDNLTFITIPNSVTTIGDLAFEWCYGLTSLTLPSSVTSIGDYAFTGCQHIISMTIPNSVTTIGDYAFNCWWDLISVTIPNSVTSIGKGAFLGCSALTEVFSYLEEPFDITDDVFQYQDNQTWQNVFTSATLHVPAGTKALYEVTDGWKNFKNIVEMEDLKPLDEDDNVDFSDEDSNITTETDLTGTIVNNMYYNIGTDAGGFSAEEGCIVITKETSDEQMEALEGLGVTDEELKQNFTGIIFKVPAGKGKVAVTAETTGNMMLKVKVGNGEPMEMELSGKLKMKVPYNVSEETMVYIFAGTTDENGARGMVPIASEQSLKIYGIDLEMEVVKGDANGDKKVNALDVDCLRNYILGLDPQPFSFESTNLNGDSVVDIVDLTLLIEMLK
ncbi:MAG: leucine-rich repeat protein [Prevotella sp.]|nr:leucine-rich repeat protein [Prevotella sp.]